MYHIFFIHSSIDGHLGSFHVLAIVNSAAVNPGYMCVFELWFIQGIYPVEGLLGHMVVQFLVFKEAPILHCWWECKLIQPLWRTMTFLDDLQFSLSFTFL